ncbi:hypothetical protein [Achromobacter deleyi]|uniref:hypothetical protein n=1 Tax=Achromobacter deleyi TaxID=1353891 RepID=UPI0014916C33|nr:hypothetical protein [Achromobacter deleyi]QVQ27030.1 hypothetical protein HLG70_00780 [Achromobacter deleyi]UIP22612.1 hypothetical protein LYZ39_08880 [Achromobacter deleyi]
MIGYQLVNGFDGVIMKTAEGAANIFPNDLENSEWLAYQNWLEAGESPRQLGIYHLLALRGKPTELY